MNFAEFKKKFQEHFERMIKDVDTLYEVNADKDKLWDTYLESFPANANEIYRVRREYDCSCCRHFIKQFGNVITIKDGKLTSVWDFDTHDDVFQPVLEALRSYIYIWCELSDVHWAPQKKVGTDYNMADEDGKIVRWEHFYVELPDRFLAPRGMSEGDYKNRYRTTRNVFHRSLKEISIEAVETVLELIASNSLYRGEEWKAPLENFLKFKREFDAFGDDVVAQDIYAWEHFKKAGEVVGKIRNHSIGVLLTDISEGMDLDGAVRRYEQIVAPANYKRPKAIYTKKMLEDAQKKVVELGYMDSLARRHARLNDISVNNILFCNRDVKNDIRGGDVFADMMVNASTKPMNFDRVEEIGIHDFVQNVLPTARELEVYLENRHSKNMVSLIAPQNPEAPSMLKWNNNFGWAYAGNVTDSIKENVKNAGGKVDGVLRFSIQWNDGNEWDQNDMDAHCILPASIYAKRRGTGLYSWYNNTRCEICYYQRHDSVTNGELDVDIINPVVGKPAVENITWPDKRRMIPGDYEFFVHCYTNRYGRSGFRAEIEFDGQIYNFEHKGPFSTDQRIDVATVHLDENGKFTITTHMDTTTSSRDIWNLKTNHFIPVSVMMHSPNYWDNQTGIGHRHCFFMLKDCRNPETPNGFYNEFLKNELMEHKRVFEALGSRMKVEYTDDQLSGVGFSMTKRDDIVVRVTGATKRVMKIKF
jgi:hypothetical protein